MRSYSRSAMALLALLSLLATLVPSLAWACPVTGRIGTPLEVCASSAPNRSPSAPQMRCCRKKLAGAGMKSCCHVVVAPNPLPGVATLADKTENRTPPFVQLCSVLDCIGIASTAARPLIAPVLPTYHTRDVSPLHSQHAFSLHSGRAPPVVRG
jgi:hypothetical protein